MKENYRSKFKEKLPVDTDKTKKAQREKKYAFVSLCIYVCVCVCVCVFVCFMRVLIFDKNKKEDRCTLILNSKLFLKKKSARAQEREE